MMIQELIRERPALHRCFVGAAVEVLNLALAADRLAVNQFFTQEVKVNTDELRDHPTIQVGSRDLFHQDEESTAIVMRPLGLINGLFGTNEKQYGFIYVQTKAIGTPEDWIDYFFCRAS